MTNRLRLKALRLVGFHNYNDELIEVHGDLFVIGSNESGKTTILDALHLILSGAQSWDLNAAAKMAGRRDEGRSLQGIILRADLAGDPHPDRKGGSITYAVAEFAQDHGKTPVTFVFGASAVDMNARARRWGAITSRRAAELPLVKKNEDGSLRIVTRDELAQSLDEPILTDMNKYRTAVADRLFNTREDFDLVTDLWRKAKSYRELSKAARGFDELFRQVLPVPDPDPFDKAAKGFRDIAEIEQNLTDLGDDVKALYRLCEIRNEARDACETLRRYRYVEAKWCADDLATTLRKNREQVQQCSERIDAFSRELSQLEAESQILDEQIKTLRANESYQTATQLEELEARLTGVDGRLATLRSRRSEAKNRLARQTRDRDTCIKAATEKLSSATRRFDELAESLVDTSVEIVEQLLATQRLLPNTIDDELPAAAIRTSVTETKRSAAGTVSEMNDEIHRLADQQEQLQSQRSGYDQELQRIDRFDDVVPAIDGLDESLEALQQRGIRPRLLYQEIEFVPGTSAEIQAAVEAAVGIQRLATLVTSPDEASVSCEVVMSVGHGIRLLDAAAVRRSGISQPTEGTSLLTFLHTDNERVKTHLQATLGTLALLAQPASDGADQHWFAMDGAGGERGVRWRLELDAPRWIGEETRRRIREEETERLRTAIEQLDVEAKTVKDELARCNRVREALRELPGQLDALDLPGSIERFRDTLDQVKENIRGIERQVGEIDDDLSKERLKQKYLSTTIADLKKQLSDVDVEALLTRLDALSAQSKETSESIGTNRIERRSAEENVKSLSREIDEIDGKLAEAATIVTDSREDLAAVLPVSSDDLDRYVFHTKRGSQIKKDNLPKLLQESTGSERETHTRLTGSDGVMSDRFASRYRFRVDDAAGWIEVRDYRDQPLDEILQERDETVKHWRETLKKKNIDLVEQILAHSLIEQLRSNVRTLQQFRDGLNRVLENLTFGHSRFQLKAKVTPEHASFVQLIQRQSLLDVERRRELREHLENRRDQLTGEGDIPPFLDYRNWYTYQFQLQHTESDNVTSLGSDELVRGSGGAQSTHHYLLLFALARFLFDRAGAKVRLLMMDEPFYGLDMQRRELLLRCAKQLDLDLIIASPDLDGTILEDTADRTTLMVEKDERDDVVLIPLVWKRRESQTELFPEPRPEAVIGHETNQ